MSDAELRQAMLEAIGQIAPEVDLESVEPDVNLREQLDLDSMDFLNVMIALDQQLGVEIPEADYPKLATLASGVAYLQAVLSR